MSVKFKKFYWNSKLLFSSFNFFGLQKYCPIYCFLCESFWWHFEMSNRHIGFVKTIHVCGVIQSTWMKLKMQSLKARERYWTRKGILRYIESDTQIILNNLYILSCSSTFFGTWFKWWCRINFSFVCDDKKS